MDYTYDKYLPIGVANDRDRTVDKAVRLIEEAADHVAVVIGFPELFIPGHPGAWYYAKRSNPLPSQGAMFQEYVKNSVKIPSLATDRLCQAAKKARAYVVIGLAEADPVFPETLYLSQLFLSDTGEIMGVHRKLVPTNVEKLVFTGGDGSYLNVYGTPYGKYLPRTAENTHMISINMRSLPRAHRYTLLLGHRFLSGHPIPHINPRRGSRIPLTFEYVSWHIRVRYLS